MAESGTCHPQKIAESPTLVSLGVANSGLCNFLGVASPGLSLFRVWPVQDSVFFWILAHREIWGWQEGSATLYMYDNRNTNLFLNVPPPSLVADITF